MSSGQACIYKRTQESPQQTQQPYVGPGGGQLPTQWSPDNTIQSGVIWDTKQCSASPPQLLLFGGAPTPLPTASEGRRSKEATLRNLRVWLSGEELF